jgi:hypothetical protein
MQDIKLISESKILSLRMSPELDDNIRPRILGNPNNSFYTQAKANIRANEVLLEESTIQTLEASEGSKIRIF